MLLVEEFIKITITAQPKEKVENIDNTDTSTWKSSSVKIKSNKKSPHLDKKQKGAPQQQSTTNSNSSSTSKGVVYKNNCDFNKSTNDNYNNNVSITTTTTTTTNNNNCNNDENTTNCNNNTKSDNFSQGFVKNFAKIRQHDSDLSPRPRRPYKSDSSSRYYNKNNSDVTGQGRIIGDKSRSVTSGGEGGGGRRQQQQQYNNHSDYKYNNRSNTPPTSSYNRYNNSPDPIKGGNNYNKQQGGNSTLTPRSYYRQQQNFSNNQQNNYSAKYENSRQQNGSNNNNGGNTGEHGGAINQNDNIRLPNYSNNDSNRSIDRQHPNLPDNIQRKGGSSSGNYNNFESGAISRKHPNAYIARNNQKPVENVETENFSNSKPGEERWVPPSLRPQHGFTLKDKNDAIFRKVRGILNKLTPEKFQDLSDDLLKNDLNSTVVLNGVILLIFEKALDEPKYSSMYAQLCKRLSKEAPNFDDPPSPNTCTFLRLLLNICRDKFLSRSTTTTSGAATSISNEQYFDRDIQDEEITTEEEEKLHVAKQRMLGNVKFIGELSKLQMLSENVLHKCIQLLLDKKQRPGATLPDWCLDIECLCQLFKTCGKNLDTEQGKKLMEQYFETMDQRSKSSQYPPRIRFMLRDIIEMRSSNWVPRKVTAPDGPVPIRQIRTDDDIIRTPYINHRNRDNRNNDRDNTDNWMNRFPLNMQSGFNDMFSSLNGNNSSPIPSTNYNNSNNNRHHNQRNNQNNHHNYNRFNKHNNNSNNHQYNNNQYNNSRNNSDQNSNSGNNSNSFNNANKDIAPRFKRTLITTAQEPVENLQMRPAANSLLFKANMNIKVPSSFPMSTPLLTKPITNSVPTITNIINPNRIESGAVIITPKSSSSLNVDAHSAEKISNVSQSSSKTVTTTSSSPIVVLKESDSNCSVSKQGSSEKSSNSKLSKKDKGMNKEEMLKRVNTFLYENLITKDAESEEMKQEDIVAAFIDLKIPDKFMKEVCYNLLNEILDKSEEHRKRTILVLQQLRKENKIQANALLDGFKQIIYKMSEKEATIPRVATHVASLLSRGVVANLCKLSDIAAFTDNGQHYPLILLVLQQLQKIMDKSDLEDLFNASRIDLLPCLPEADRNKDRLAEILEDRNLTFLYPLLKVETEMWKQIQNEKNPQIFYKWIRDNINVKYYTDPVFITSLMTVTLKHITNTTTLAEGIDIKKHPEKSVIEKEESLFHKYSHILESFVNGKIDLQLVAIYALQVYCYNTNFPKGILCRWFKMLYESNVIEEDAFFRWKEEISDEYPGKGTALFQVNNWLTWLEQAESEDED